VFAIQKRLDWKVQGAEFALPKEASDFADLVIGLRSVSETNRIPGDGSKAPLAQDAFH
jgi:hypothetical protein